MSGIVHFETFLMAGILLNLTPGNDTIFILAKSIGQGKKAGIVSALGIGVGSVIHTLLAAFGLSLIIAQSLVLFNVIKYAGAAYLVYLGCKMLLDKKQLGGEWRNEEQTVNYYNIFRDAILTNVLNPKVALFFIAFLPQFIDPGMKDTVLPFLMLGLTFITTGTSWCLLLALFASTFFGKLKNNPRATLIVNRVCGLALVGLGIKVAVTGRK